MIGILIALGLSWLLLYLVEKKSILVLGVLPLGKRLKELGFGFLVTAVLCTAVQLLEAHLTQASWVLNPDFDFLKLTAHFYWDFKSVFTEELLFRGALLYLLIKWIGPMRAIGVSAIAFGVYHWFTFGILGNLMPMIFVFIGTGMMGFAWAWAFYKTKSIALALGLHLGWNFTLNTIFSKGPLGDGLFLLTDPQREIYDWFGLIGLCIIPLIVLLVVWMIKKNRSRFGG